MYVCVCIYIHTVYTHIHTSMLFDLFVALSSKVKPCDRCFSLKPNYCLLEIVDNM